MILNLSPQPVKRTSIDTGFYDGGLDQLKQELVVVQITNGLNKLHVAMQRSDVSDKLAIMTCCAIVKLIITKSPYGTDQSLHPGQIFFGTDS